jgi:hypothetical protein
MRQSDEFSFVCTGCRQPIDPVAPDSVAVWTLIDVPGSGRRNEWIPVEGGIAHHQCLPNMPGYWVGPMLAHERFAHTGQAGQDELVAMSPSLGT